jgi:hypothetical protein
MTPRQQQRTSGPGTAATAPAGKEALPSVGIANEWSVTEILQEVAYLVREVLEPSSSSAREHGRSLRTMQNVSSGTRFYAHGVVKLQREKTAADQAQTSDIGWLPRAPGRNLCDLRESCASSTARHMVTDVRHAPHTQVHALLSPAPVPLSHFEEFFGVPQPVLMAQSPERSYQLYRCSQDGLSGPARLEACLPYRTGNNAKLEEVLGALTLCPRGKMPGRLGNHQSASSGCLPARVFSHPNMAWPIEVFLAFKFWK